MEKFIDKPLLENIANSLDSRYAYLKIFILSLTIILILIAISRPQLGFRWREVKREGLDIIFAMDMSKSMLADDLSPNRLGRSKLAVRDMVRSLKGDRVGLVAFSGKAFLQCPLTLDYDGFLVCLRDLGVDTISRGGTSVAEAIKHAVDTYEKGAKRHKVLIVISDGEEHEGDALRMAEKAKKENIKIFCIGVGSKAGSFIPHVDKNGRTVFLKDARGNRIRSRLNEKLLKEVAFATGGVYAQSTRTDFGLRGIYKEKISQFQKKEIAGKKNKVYNERFQIPLFLAILLLCIETLLPERRKHK